MRTMNPLGVVAFEDRVAPAIILGALNGIDVGSSIVAILRAGSLHDFHTYPDANVVIRSFTESDGDIVSVRSDRVGDDQVLSVSRTEAETKTQRTQTRTTALEATPGADPGPVSRDASRLGPVRDAGPGTAPRGSSIPAALPAALPAIDLTTPENTDANVDQSTQSAASGTSVPTNLEQTGPVVWRASDYVFIEPESVEPPPAEPLPMPEEPLLPDEPQIVPALDVESASPAGSPAPTDPLAGLLPFNLSDLEESAQDLLSRVAGIGTELIEDLGAGSEYTWLGLGALAAAGAVYASRPTRRNRLAAGPREYDSVFARWEGADAAPPR